MEVKLFVQMMIVVAVVVTIVCGTIVIVLKIINAGQRRQEVASTNLDYLQDIAKMQFNLWWVNKGLSVVNDYIINNGISSIRAETIRDDVEALAKKFIVNQLTMNATRQLDQFARMNTFSIVSRRQLASAIAYDNACDSTDENELSDYGYDIENLKVTFQQ